MDLLLRPQTTRDRQKLVWSCDSNERVSDLKNLIRKDYTEEEEEETAFPHLLLSLFRQNLLEFLPSLIQSMGYSHA